MGQCGPSSSWDKVMLWEVDITEFQNWQPQARLHDMLICYSKYHKYLLNVNPPPITKEGATVIYNGVILYTKNQRLSQWEMVFHKLYSTGSLETKQEILFFPTKYPDQIPEILNSRIIYLGAYHDASNSFFLTSVFRRGDENRQAGPDSSRLHLSALINHFHHCFPHLC